MVLANMPWQKSLKMTHKTNTFTFWWLWQDCSRDPWMLRIPSVKKGPSPKGCFCFLASTWIRNNLL